MLVNRTLGLREHHGSLVRAGDSPSGTAAAAVEVIEVVSDDEVIFIRTTTAPVAFSREKAGEQSTLGAPIDTLSVLKERFEALQLEARAAGFKIRTGTLYGMLQCAWPCSGFSFNNILSAHRKF